MAVARTPMQFRGKPGSTLGGVTVAGFGIRQVRALEAPRMLGQYAIVLVLDGQGAFADGRGWSQPLGPGDMLLLFPDIEHLYNPNEGTTWVTSFLCFWGPVFDLWRVCGALDPARPIFHCEPVDGWSRRLGDVLGPERRIGADPPLVETARLLGLLANLTAGEPGAGLAEEDRRWAERACGVIEATLGEEPDWEATARQFGLTVEGFRKRFVRLIGQPPARYRMGRLIDRACALMAESRWTDRQIADRLGFCDEFYFSRRFKEITGRSPRAFRRGLALGAAGEPRA